MRSQNERKDVFLYCLKSQFESKYLDVVFRALSVFIRTAELRMAQQYGEVDYWDDRYTKEKGPFEWYMGYGGIRNFLTAKYLMSSGVAYDKSQSTNEVIEGPFQSTEHCRVLIAGCGNSQVGESMLCDGFANITNVDFSSIVIEQMRERYSDEWHDKLYTRLCRERKLAKVEANSVHIGIMPHVQSPTKEKVETMTIEKSKMRFECMDLTKMERFMDTSFNLIICKGALDAVLCSANTTDRVQCMMNECHRILDSKYGAMIIISHGEPENRLNYFDCNLWDIKTYTVPKPYVPGEKTGR